MAMVDRPAPDWEGKQHILRGLGFRRVGQERGTDSGRSCHAFPDRSAAACVKSMSHPIRRGRLNHKRGRRPEMQNHSSVPWWRTRTGIAVVGFGLVIAFYILRAHYEHALGALPYLLLWR